MAVLVQKYGGSSVADVEKLGLVAQKVVAAKEAGFDVVVVVSAMGKTTDGLLSLAKQAASAGHEHAFDPPRRELDMLLSTGERVSMALLSIAIQARGHDAISFTGSQSGIITNDRHFDARIIEVRPHRIEDELARGRIVIVAGYQGMSYRREITTLGRGGSDTTAVALAAALGATRCEIYSDVDGVYSADPRVVAEAIHLPELDLAVLQEMAEAGAKVLNAQAVEWARRAKITLHARRTTDPLGAAGVPPKQTTAALPAAGDSGAGPAASRARAIVGLDRVVQIRMPTSRFADFAAQAAALDLPLVDVFMEREMAGAHVPLLNVPDWPRCRRVLEGDDLAASRTMSIVEGRAIVSVVGDGLTASSAALPLFMSALASEQIEVFALTAGPLRIAGTVASAHLASAQRALHRAFVESGSTYAR